MNPAKKENKKTQMADARKTKEEVDLTISDIAKEFGTSRTYISLLEKQALEKLKKKLSALGINSLDQLL